MGRSKGNEDNQPARLYKIDGQYFDEVRDPEGPGIKQWTTICWVRIRILSSKAGNQTQKSSFTYPQGNIQVEAINKILLRDIEKRIRESKRKWPEELANVLWAYKTSPRTSTGETPFKLAYWIEAMLPIKAGSPSHRPINFDEIANEEMLRTNMEIIDEVRDQAIARM
ncbi:uncharacterized protein LOC141674088 [Apium graveolens]|uniref:uncharacterized protein LOC141674088 n=1 Tax=Apium graveolens TaxID=4045 RepID=UPI003D7AC651